MNQEPDKETQDFIDKDEELKYAQMIEKGEYFKIPKSWLEFFLKRSELNLESFERLHVTRPHVKETLTRRIGEIQKELAKRA